MRYAFVAALVLAFVAISVLVDRGAGGQRIVTGTVTRWQAGETISVANEETGPESVILALRQTVYEGDPAAIEPGVRVTVWYRSVGERRPVADRVRVLTPATRP
jgi:hypothetical protein